ncbi:hypothetical protein [Deinococcus sp. QL22]|uniref:hypothetical protein n=1 Tax=Deinococcus sp. QL22 TaxID=2939437 RepID=UPI00201762CB|nr:hypothetical protein [Deinococcus sp. QL22]UQN08692.1 hypothetical protein M1R55_21465 [Deinococcus sp. QL22]
MKRIVLGLTLLASFALAADLKYNVSVNGRPTPDPAIVVNGKTYVPLSALKTLGVPATLQGTTLNLGAQTAAAPGGANQRVSLEGCVGDTLFNGIWRMTVKKVEAIGPDVGLGPGWGVTVELRNGTTTRTSLHDTGLESVELVQPDGNTLAFEVREAEERLLYKEISQAGGVTYQLRFHTPNARTPASEVPRPAKLIVQLNPKRLTAGYLIAAKVAYTTPNPSFRVGLTCQR